MDLDSLPNEMLTSILKYTTFKTLQRTRKLNQRVDRLSKRAHIGIRVPVGHLRADRPGLGIVHTGRGYSQMMHPYYYLSVMISDEENCASLDWMLSRVTIMYELRIKESFFADQMMTVMRNQPNCFRNMKKITVYGKNFMKTEKEANDFLQTLCPKLETLEIIKSDPENLRNICNYEILGSRKWKCLNFTSFVPHASFHTDDNFLLTMAPKCQNFSFPTCTDFSLSAAITLLKNCSAVTSSSYQFNIGWLTFEGDPLVEVRYRLEIEFPGASTLRTSTFYTHTLYRVLVKNQSQMHRLKFKAPLYFP